MPYTKTEDHRPQWGAEQERSNMNITKGDVLELRRRVRETNVAEVRGKLLAAFME